jgi:hypothetical protein
MEVVPALVEPETVVGVWVDNHVGQIPHVRLVPAIGTVSVGLDILIGGVHEQGVADQTYDELSTCVCNRLQNSIKIGL